MDKWICPEGTGRDTCHRCEQAQDCTYKTSKDWLITGGLSSAEQESRSGWYDKDREAWQ